eukprot:COSAG04_NODE_2139_length_4717_cov_1.826981_1_plen_493_part_00
MRPYRAAILRRMVMLVVLAAAPELAGAQPPLRAASPRSLPWEQTMHDEPGARAAARGILELLPAGETMTEEGLDESVGDYMRVKNGRLTPVWENHTAAERTANLRLHGAERRRRRLQTMSGTNVAKGTPQERGSRLVAVLEQPDSACGDPLATNTGQPPPCTYSCADLIEEYFPEPQSQTTRCFLFDPASDTWPEVGGQNDELLRMRQQRFETHTYVSREDGADPSSADEISFAIGAGRVCRNVTITSTFLGTGGTRNEIMCLVDGEHEYNHTIDEAHTVEVVGYAESDVHEGAGGTTAFVVGECVDVLIRVTTTSAGGEPVRWTLDDGGHNGPWQFVSAGEVHEEETCMHDNEFSLTNLDAPASWQGSVEVVGFIHYHNTITIPSDENWIVQGVVDSDSGLPSNLDGRLKSGTAVERSHANIVLRHVRISGQVAPVDANLMPRTDKHMQLWGRSPYGAGGAFEYDGGSSDPSNLAKIVLVESVFDHNSASS